MPSLLECRAGNLGWRIPGKITFQSRPRKCGVQTLASPEEASDAIAVASRGCGGADLNICLHPRRFCAWIYIVVALLDLDMRQRDHKIEKWVLLWRQSCGGADLNISLHLRRFCAWIYIVATLLDLDIETT